MSWSAAVTVAAVIQHRDRFLMVEEAPQGFAVINQPAGHLEFGESLVDAVRREVREETGRHFRPLAIVGIYQWTVPGSDHTYLRVCFTGTVGEPETGLALDPDIRATHWLTRSEIADGPLPPRSPLVLRCLDDACEGRQLGALELLRVIG
jgi:ADP-ribose pyrophosphatase YjhB (NUDIX family)